MVPLWGTYDAWSAELEVALGDAGVSGAWNVRAQDKTDSTLLGTLWVASVHSVYSL